MLRNTLLGFWVTVGFVAFGVFGVLLLTDFFSMGTLFMLAYYTCFALIGYWVVSAAIIVINRGKARWLSRDLRA